MHDRPSRPHCPDPPGRLDSHFAINHSLRSAALVLIGALLLVCSTLVDPAGAEQAGPTAPARSPYRPPVDAPVTDPFRAPANPYAAGNRGIEYRTVPGTPVRAAGDGVVVFAGQVAGGLHVTIQHPDGIRTSYSFLAVILVAAGDPIQRGTPVGLAGAMLHVGARIGSTYIDPALLWGGPPHVWLVSLDAAASGFPARSFQTTRSRAF